MSRSGGQSEAKPPVFSPQASMNLVGLMNHGGGSVVAWGCKSASELDDRGRLFPEGWEKKIYHDKNVDQIKKTPTTERGGRTYPKARTLYRSRAPAGRGEERRKESGTAEDSESRR
ncbi:hypothetical protein TNCV_3629711 [Trichonephila clavipes]|nr:hypothetical protein TNCV_3629711 [Trichonephila clavipes]